MCLCVCMLCHNVSVGSCSVHVLCVPSRELPLPATRDRAELLRGPRPHSIRTTPRTLSGRPDYTLSSTHSQPTVMVWNRPLLVDEPSPWGKSPLGAWLRIAHSSYENLHRCYHYELGHYPRSPHPLSGRIGLDARACTESGWLVEL
jgi:hypothetical protein